MKISKRRMRCYNHTVTGRTWDDYVLVNDFGNVQYFACKECKQADDILAEREDRIYANEQKQKEASTNRQNKIFYAKARKRRINQERNLWDFDVKHAFLRGMKGQGVYSLDIPKEILQLIRATMKLTRLIKIYSKQDALAKNEKCKKHGAQYSIKANLSNHFKRKIFKCRQCAAEDLEKMIKEKARSRY